MPPQQWQWPPSKVQGAGGAATDLPAAISVPSGKASILPLKTRGTHTGYVTSAPGTCGVVGEATERRARERNAARCSVHTVPQPSMVIVPETVFKAPAGRRSEIGVLARVTPVCAQVSMKTGRGSTAAPVAR